MALYLYKGEHVTNVVTQPPGVTVQVKPGQTVELGAGFEHLKHDARFELVEEAPVVEVQEAEQAEPPKGKGKK